MDVRSRGGRRYLKRFEAWLRADGRVQVETLAGYPGHTFDDIRRSVVIGKRGGLSGQGREGNGRANKVKTKTVKGSQLLYAMNAQRANT